VYKSLGSVYKSLGSVYKSLGTNDKRQSPDDNNAVVLLRAEAPARDEWLDTAPFYAMERIFFFLIFFFYNKCPPPPGNTCRHSRAAPCSAGRSGKGD
jgi:hypothetical protein